MQLPIPSPKSPTDASPSDAPLLVAFGSSRRVASETVGAMGLALLGHTIFGVILPASVPEVLSAGQLITWEFALLVPLVGYVALCEALRRRAHLLPTQPAEPAARVSEVVAVLLIALSIVGTVYLLYVRHETVASGLGALAAGGLPSSARIVVYGLVLALTMEGWRMAAATAGRTEPIPLTLLPRMRLVAIAAIVPALIALLYACFSLLDDEPLALSLLGQVMPPQLARSTSELVFGMRLLGVAGSCITVLMASSGLAALGLGRDPLVAPHVARLGKTLAWIVVAILSSVAISSCLIIMAAMDAMHGAELASAIMGVCLCDMLVLGSAALVAVCPWSMLSLAAAERLAAERWTDAPPFGHARESHDAAGADGRDPGFGSSPDRPARPLARTLAMDAASLDSFTFAPAAFATVPEIAVTRRYGFRAGGLDALGLWLVNVVLTICTLGLATIFGVTGSRWRTWRITNTTRDGSAWQFHVSFMQGVLRSIVDWLLLFCTAGLAFPWVVARRAAFEAAHTRTAEGHEMRFTGSGFEVLGMALLGILAIVCTGGLAWPFVAVAITRWRLRNTMILDPRVPDGEYRLRFDAGGLSYFVQGLLTQLLMIVTLGLYWPWARASYQQLVWTSTSDTMSPPVPVPLGPRTPGQWAVAVGVAIGACGLALAVVAIVTLTLAGPGSSRTTPDVIAYCDTDGDGDVTDGEFSLCGIGDDGCGIPCDEDCDLVVSEDEGDLCVGAYEEDYDDLY